MMWTSEFLANHKSELHVGPSSIQLEYPRTSWGGFPYSASYDAEIAGDVHRVLFENKNIIILEASTSPELHVHAPAVS